MELIENLLQLLVTFVGALLSGIFYWKSRRQADFLLLCFYGCFALGAFYWTLYLLLFNTTPLCMACACVWRAAAGVLLHLRGHSLQPNLVRYDDMALLLRHSRACLCENADGHGAEYAVFP